MYPKISSLHIKCKMHYINKRTFIALCYSAFKNNNINLRTIRTRMYMVRGYKYLVKNKQL